MADDAPDDDAQRRGVFVYSVNMGDDTPSTTGPSGRDGRGRFTEGNRASVGNPHAAAVAKFRAVLLASVTEEDLAAVVRVLVDQAKMGEGWAVKEMLDRLVGRPRLDAASEEDQPPPIRIVWADPPRPAGQAAAAL